MKRQGKFFLFLTLLLTMVTQGAWGESLTFNVRSWDGTNKKVVTTQTTKDAAVLTSSDDWVQLGADDSQDHYYVVKGDISIKALSCYGKSHLILADNATLNVNHIKLETGRSLSIYSQSDGDSQGKLIVKNYIFDGSDSYPVYGKAAAIGGGENAAMGSLYIHGGDVTAKASGDIVTRGYGAGIGGGSDSGIGGEVIIYGGKVNAMGAKYGAGIGGGDCGNQGGQVVIYGGEVTASSAHNGAGIGGGDGNQVRGNGGVIKIYGGKVKAKGGYVNLTFGVAAAGGAGLGGGRNGSAGEVYIYGGEVEAIGGKDAAGIGGSRDYGGGKCEISGGTVFAKGGIECAIQLFDRSAPAIGGGRLEGPGSDVSITGGKVTLVKRGYDDDSCPFIGGGNDVDDDGTLNIGPGMKMSISTPDWKFNQFFEVNSSTAAPPLTLVDNAANRVEYCRSHSYGYAVIEPCTHDGATFSYTAGPDTHTRTCSYCNYGIIENHSYGEGNKCACGKIKESSVSDSHWGVTLYRATAAGTTNYAQHVVMYVSQKDGGQPFCVPAVDATQGLTLMGYLKASTAPSGIELLSSEEGQLIKVDNVINITENTTLYPRYRYRFTPTWEWAADYTSATVTLKLTGKDDITLQGSNVVISQEDIKDENNEKCGVRYTATATYKRDLFSDYIFKSHREVYTLALSDAANNDAVLAGRDGVTADVTLDGRTLYKDGSWNTLCLPFDVTISGSVLNGATVQTLNSAASNLNSEGLLTIKFDDVSTTAEIPAGTPFIIKWTSGTDITDPVFTNVTMKNAEPTAVTFSNALGDDCLFVGSYSPFSITDANIDEIIYLGANNTLGYATAARTLRSCRTHFVVPKTSTSGARAMTRSIVNFGDENTTGIESIDNGFWTMNSSDSAWFSLDGRKLSRKPATKGVYIHSGNKVIIK